MSTSVTSGTLPRYPAPLAVEEAGSAEEGVVPSEIGVCLEQIGDLLREAGEQDRAAAHTSHAVARSTGLVDRNDVPMPVSVRVDQVRTERSVREVVERAVVAQHGLDAF